MPSKSLLSKLRWRVRKQRSIHPPFILSEKAELTKVRSAFLVFQQANSSYFYKIY